MCFFPQSCCHTLAVPAPPLLANLTIWQWSWMVSALAFAAALAASTHALIYKREPRSAALWTVVIWLVPTIGPILYLLFGINRIRRRASALREDMVRHQTPSQLEVDASGTGVRTGVTTSRLRTWPHWWSESRKGRWSRDTIEPLIMAPKFSPHAEAIERAETSVRWLLSFLTGRAWHALVEAWSARGGAVSRCAC